RQCCPLQVGLFDGDQALARSPCARTALSLGFGGNALIDQQHFYGTLAGVGVIRGSYALDRKTELFGTWDAAQIRFIQNATLSQTAFSLGQLSAGATRLVWATERFQLAPGVRLVL